MDDESDDGYESSVVSAGSDVDEEYDEAVEL